MILRPRELVFTSNWFIEALTEFPDRSRPSFSKNCIQMLYFSFTSLFRNNYSIAANQLCGHYVAGKNDKMN